MTESVTASVYGALKGGEKLAHVIRDGTRDQMVYLQPGLLVPDDAAYAAVDVTGDEYHVSRVTTRLEFSPSLPPETDVQETNQFLLVVRPVVL